MEQKSLEIDGHEYVLTAVPAKRAWPMALRVKEAKDRAIMALVSGGGNLDAVTQVGTVLASAAAMASTSATWMRQLRDPEFHREVVLPLWQLATRDGNGIMPDLNALPDVPLAELYKLTDAAIEFNFGPFCAASGTIAASIAEMLAALRGARPATTDATTTDGPSG